MGLALANYPEGKGSGIKDIFERAHAAHAGEFGKMDGIDTHYAAKLVNPETCQCRGWLGTRGRAMRLGLREPGRGAGAQV